MPDNKKHTAIADRLMTWYARHARSLPWRETKDPYKIWVSEILLQQTTIRQGLPYYNRFLEVFPSVFDLASAQEDKLLKVWEGLGYYSRARNMHKTAKIIVEHHSGKLPGNYHDLVQLPGIGPYTAAAIASIAFGEDCAVVDGNVIRLVSRLFGIKAPVDVQATKKHLLELAQLLIKGKDPGSFNQAMMDFGSTVCTPKAPACSNCMLKTHCVAFKKEHVSLIPHKSKKLKKRKRYFLFFVPENDFFYIQKRPPGDVWHGLYQFPMIETTHGVFAGDTTMDSLGLSKDFLQILKPYRQSLTHQHIYAKFVRVKSLPSSIFEESKVFEKVAYSRIRDFAFPKIIDLYLSDKSIPLF